MAHDTTALDRVTEPLAAIGINCWTTVDRRPKGGPTRCGVEVARMTRMSLCALSLWSVCYVRYKHKVGLERVFGTKEWLWGKLEMPPNKLLHDYVAFSPFLFFRKDMNRLNRLTKAGLGRLDRK
jgi:hypothetical protein